MASDDLMWPLAGQAIVATVAVAVALWSMRRRAIGRPLIQGTELVEAGVLILGGITILAYVAREMSL